MGYSIPAISGQPQQMLCITIHIDDTKYVVQTCARMLMFQKKSVVFVSIDTGHGQQDFVSIAADLITNVDLLHWAASGRVNTRFPPADS